MKTMEHHETLTDGLADDLHQSFPTMVRSLQDGIFSGVLQMTRNRHDAEDVTQETFIRAYRALEGYEAQRIRELRLRPWVWTIAINLCRNRARSAARRGPIAPLPDRAASEPSPEDQAVEMVMRSEWHLRLSGLSTAHRTAVVLRHVVGLSYEEIAHATGRPAGTVKADVHRGIARLRTILEREHEEETP
jgi:RNA polymerase sigma-70 factor (ECF subfamily)